MEEQDDFPFGEPEEETTPTQSDANPMKQLRTHANKLEKQLKTSQTELEELRAFKAGIDQKSKAEQVGSIFTELGLNPAQVKLYELAMPDAEPSKETVGKWAVEYGLAQATEGAVPDESTGFTPTTTPEGIAPGAKRLSRDEWIELSVKDSAAGQRAFQQGRVDLSDVRQGLGPDK